MNLSGGPQAIQYEFARSAACFGLRIKIVCDQADCPDVEVRTSMVDAARA
jgi:hypothetical protein